MDLQKVSKNSFFNGTESHILLYVDHLPAMTTSYQGDTVGYVFELKHNGGCQTRLPFSKEG